MSFGWSASDISACIKLIIRIGKALNDSSGSELQFQTTVKFLNGVETTTQGLRTVLLKRPGLTSEPALREHADTLMQAVTRFRRKIEGYDTSLGERATSLAAKKAWKKIQLELFGHVEELRIEISHPQRVVNDLINLQALELLVDLSNTPTITPQALQASTSSIQDNFPTIIESITQLRQDIEQRTTQLSNSQQQSDANIIRDITQVHQQVVSGNDIQKTTAALAQVSNQALDQWRKEIQISIRAIQAQMRRHFEASLASLEATRIQQAVQHRETERQAARLCTLQKVFWPVVSMVGNGLTTSCIFLLSALAGGAGSGRGGGSSGPGSHRYGEQDPLLQDTRSPHRSSTHRPSTSLPSSSTGPRYSTSKGSDTSTSAASHSTCGNSSEGSGNGDNDDGVSVSSDSS